MTIIPTTTVVPRSTVINLALTERRLSAACSCTWDSLWPRFCALKSNQVKKTGFSQNLGKIVVFGPNLLYPLVDKKAFYFLSIFPVFLAGTKEKRGKKNNDCGSTSVVTFRKRGIDRVISPVNGAQGGHCRKRE